MSVAAAAQGVPPAALAVAALVVRSRMDDHWEGLQEDLPGQADPAEDVVASCRPAASREVACLQVGVR